ncbi:sterile alpha motif domain-containing protein 3-like [Melanotaenia boesemani]|uniref:sterile alpha motif domain-containing protein 3-like n=1 Tax=Melanotaenia boesemani TaxID=1250792 RepID=UPI001C044B3D|nr:sterile alpha motif domain-containing protein 3-like [Melanotaenia boesemani]XP_041828254.1 sterile alpha motif domain-containing protein 3-like [Melanotaenia boesemani]
MAIQFQDEEFGQFCNLNNMEDLPAERIKLKVIIKPPPSSPQSDSTLHTGSLDTSSRSSGETSRRSKPWPNLFIIPTFSYDIELKLWKGNDAYQKDGSLLPLTNDIKTGILDKVGRAMYDFNAYPTQKQIEDVAKALVEKHPCLKEPGSKEGFYCWKFSIGFKMGNLRQKYRIAGCPELAVNRKRSAGQETRKMKKAKRSEINFLPDFPQGRSPNNLEEDREMLLDEVKKKKPDSSLIDSLMGRTFALRRQEIVENEPLVTEVERRWPALFSERQIGAEFMRLVSVDLLKSFLSGLDQHLPRLMDLYKARKRRKTKLGHNMELHSLLESLDFENSNQSKRSVALLGLPFFLKEDPLNFIKFSKNTNFVEEPAVWNSVDVGLLITTEQTEEMTARSKIVDVAVILEEHIVLHELRDVTVLQC